MALEDAFVLSRLLEDWARPLEEVFRRYDQVRRPRVDLIAGLSARNVEMRKKAGPWGLWLKEMGIWSYMGISGVLGVKNGFMNQKHVVHDVEVEEL